MASSNSMGNAMQSAYIGLCWYMSTKLGYHQLCNAAVSLPRATSGSWLDQLGAQSWCAQIDHCKLILAVHLHCMGQSTDGHNCLPQLSCLHIHLSLAFCGAWRLTVNPLLGRWVYQRQRRAATKTKCAITSIQRTQDGSVLPPRGESRRCM